MPSHDTKSHTGGGKSPDDLVKRNSDIEYQPGTLPRGGQNELAEVVGKTTPQADHLIYSWTEDRIATLFELVKEAEDLTGSSPEMALELAQTIVDASKAIENTPSWHAALFQLWAELVCIQAEVALDKLEAAWQRVCCPSS